MKQSPSPLTVSVRTFFATPRVLRPLGCDQVTARVGVLWTPHYRRIGPCNVTIFIGHLIGSWSPDREFDSMEKVKASHYSGLLCTKDLQPP